MSTPETPRTWTLECENYVWRARAYSGLIHVKNSEPVEVIEKAPVDARAKLIERVRSAMRPLGYAVGLHGSEQRDLDLIAVPWVEDAEPDRMKIADALRDAGFDELGIGAEARPHGRLGFALHGVPSAAKVKYIDLSVMLPAVPVDAERKRMLDVERPVEDKLHDLNGVSKATDDPCLCRKAGDTGEDCPWKCPPYRPVARPVEQPS